MQMIAIFGPLLAAWLLAAMPRTTNAQAMTRSEFSKHLHQHHHLYREQSLNHRRFKHSDMLPLVKALENHGFGLRLLGQSVHGREIYMASLGTGPTKVLLWSQMHGDEATATMALFDIFNFFGHRTDGLDSLRELLRTKLTLHFIPMLNPDGAEVWARRTALGIDMNRDALRLACPESRLLKGVRDELEAHIGFNLHDQRIHYTVGYSPRPATISFLAPAYNQAKEVNSVRARAMKLIAAMTEDLGQFIPGQIAKYNDEFEPRAFGDNIQKWGTSTVLIESGGYANDPEKQYIRQLNFVALLSAFYALAQGEEAQYNEAQYWAIPENRTQLRPLLLRRVALRMAETFYTADISFDRKEKTAHNKHDFYHQSEIDDLGDLSTLYGYEEVDCEGLEVSLGKIYPEDIGSHEALLALDADALLAQGYTAVNYTGGESLGREPDKRLRFHVLTGKGRPDTQIKIEHNPSLVFSKEGKVQFAVINGFVLRPGQAAPRANALVY